MHKDILIDAYGRIREEVHAAVEGLAPEDLDARPGGTPTPISWLVWHLTRVQDDHVADAAGTPQVWLTRRLVESGSALDLPPRDTGYGHTTDEVAGSGAMSGDLLDRLPRRRPGPHAGVPRTLTGEDLEPRRRRPLGPGRSPSGVRLVSVLSDDLQHVGQAAYVRGLLQARRSPGARRPR